MQYGFIVITDKSKADFNLFLAMVEGEPAESENCSRPCNQGGVYGDPVTHWLGGRSFTPEKRAQYEGFATAALAAPQGGWPWNGLTEEAAAAAVAEYRLYIADSLDPNDAMALLLAETGLAIVNEPEPE